MGDDKHNKQNENSEGLDFVRLLFGSLRVSKYPVEFQIVEKCTTLCDCRAPAAGADCGPPQRQVRYGFLHTDVPEILAMDFVAIFKIVALNLENCGFLWFSLWLQICFFRNRGCKRNPKNKQSGI